MRSDTENICAIHLVTNLLLLPVEESQVNTSEDMLTGQELNDNVRLWSSWGYRP